MIMLVASQFAKQASTDFCRSGLAALPKSLLCPTQPTKIIREAVQSFCDPPLGQEL